MLCDTLCVQQREQPAGPGCASEIPANVDIYDPSLHSVMPFNGCSLTTVCLITTHHRIHNNLKVTSYYLNLFFFFSFFVHHTVSIPPCAVVVTAGVCSTCFTILAAYQSKVSTKKFEFLWDLWLEKKPYFYRFYQQSFKDAHTTHDSANSLIQLFC